MHDLNGARAPITVLIAAEVRLYRDGLAATLAARAHLRVDGIAATPLEAVNAVRDLEPDVVIVDVSLDDVLGLMRALRAASAKSHILAIAVREELTTILNYAEAGADGFVTANSSLAELVEAIERAAAGELLCSPRIAAQLLRRATIQANPLTQNVVGHSLTGRELQVFAQLKLGRSNKQIAITLSIAEATVKNHVHHVLEKLHVSTRAQAVAATLPSHMAVIERHGSSRSSS